MINRNNMLEMTGKPHKFFEAMLYPNDPEVLKFAKEWYQYVKDKHPDKAAAVN
jgi:hypothetical protein